MTFKMDQLNVLRTASTWSCSARDSFLRQLIASPTAGEVEAVERLPDQLLIRSEEIHPIDVSEVREGVQVIF